MGTPRFSPGEERLIAILSEKGEAIKTTDLVEPFYAGRSKPENPRKVIVGVVNSLVEKTSRLKLGFRVKRSERAGPRPMMVWYEGASD